MTTYLPQKSIPEKWMKAAVVGSLWAVIEIVLGSMLHNLKVPMAGTALSFITVYMVIAFFQLWPVKGMIWRAGLICALMKSLSPSAIILGPMAGILSEALLLELLIRFTGRNVVAYMLGGALAVFSALMQKAITFLILYGWDIVKLLENMYRFAVRRLQIDNIPPEYALGVLALIYLVSGGIASAAGYMAGKKFVTGKNSTNAPSLQPQAKGSLFNHSRKQNYSVVMLLIIFLLLIAGLLIIGESKLHVSALFTLIFTGGMYWRYKNNMRFLRKPAFWLQLTIILLFSAIFFKGISVDSFFTRQGWITGLHMVFRALVLLSAFSGISNELKNPVVKNILYQRGLKNLYQSVEIAFSALPGLMNAFSTNKKAVLGFRKLTHTMLRSSHSLLKQFTEMEKNRPDVYILTGDVDEGKTSAAREIVSSLQSRGCVIEGFFSAGQKEHHGHQRYFVEDIHSGQQKLLCSQNPAAGTLRTGRFYFSEEGLQYGRDILLQAPDKSPHLVVVDELGPLELNDRGWTPALERLLQQSSIPHLWIVREKLVKVIMRKWHIGDVTIFNLKKDSAEEIAEQLDEQLSRIRSR